MDVSDVSWSEVKHLWDTQLWPGRDSEPVSSMKYMGGYDLDLKREIPKFFAVWDSLDDEIIGVNSVVRTGAHEFRSRGLWTHPKHRGKGVAKILLGQTIDEARYRGGHVVWTMPRFNALHTYESVGFIQTTPFEAHDYGENCYAIFSLRTIEEIANEAKKFRERREHFWRHQLVREFEAGARPGELRTAMRPLADMEEEDWR